MWPALHACHLHFLHRWRPHIVFVPCKDERHLSAHVRARVAREPAARAALVQGAKLLDQVAGLALGLDSNKPNVNNKR